MTERTRGRPYDAAPFLVPLTLPMLRLAADPSLSSLRKSIARSVALPDSAAEISTELSSFPGRGVQRGRSPAGDLVATLPANLRVLFVLQEMENQAVSGNGVADQCWVRWETHGSVATDENGGPFSLPAPMPGEVWPVPHANVIYQGLVQDGCGSTPVFPVQFHSSVGEMEDIFSEYVSIGEFEATDDTTLQPNGFWNFAYTIRATGTGGGVSDFMFKGIVSVTCTNVGTL